MIYDFKNCVWILTDYGFIVEAEFGDEFDYRALMVIKTTEKTMARQRKGAISNWKVCSIPLTSKKFPPYSILIHIDMISLHPKGPHTTPSDQSKLLTWFGMTQVAGFMICEQDMSIKIHL